MYHSMRTLASMKSLNMAHMKLKITIDTRLT